MRALAKRQRLSASSENTDTEPETDDDLLPNPITPLIVSKDKAHLRALAELSPDLLPQAYIGVETSAQRPSQSTVQEAQPAERSSHSLGGSFSYYGPDAYLDLLVTNLPTSPAHTRLRATLALHEFLRKELAETQGGPDAGSQPSAPLQEDPSQPSSQPPLEACCHADTHTYGTLRSLCGSGSQGELRRGSKSQLQPNSNARSNARTQIDARSRPRPPIDSRPPVSARPQTGARHQPALHPGSQGSHGAGQHRLDPVSQARVAMVAFNCEHTREHASSLVQSVTRQTERTQNEHTEVPPRLAHELLPDDEEIWAWSAAIASGSHPVSLFDFFESHDLTYAYIQPRGRKKSHSRATPLGLLFRSSPWRRSIYLPRPLLKGSTRLVRRSCIGPRSCMRRHGTPSSRTSHILQRHLQSWKL